MVKLSSNLFIEVKHIYIILIYHDLFRKKPSMEDIESNLSMYLNLSSEERDYNVTDEDLKLREYIKTLMTIGLGLLNVGVAVCCLVMEIICIKTTIVTIKSLGILQDSQGLIFHQIQKFGFYQTR